jgi:hypothetical protein
LLLCGARAPGVAAIRGEALEQRWFCLAFPNIGFLIKLQKKLPLPFRVRRKRRIM